ncbi:MAG TPA: hypothetical protein VLW84_14000 [Terriglobales bacterium]|nr:hypothetical protein [Terriglobales bacterium]
MNRTEGSKFAGLLAAVILLTASAICAQAQDIPVGTTIRVRMIDKLSSEQNQIGDTFHATLEEPIAVNSSELYPKGADVLGRITDVHKSGHLSEPGELDLTLLTISSHNAATSVRVEPLVIKGESHTKSNATKIGGGAALGAVIGAIAGGGKGAGIGTAAGAAAGTGAAAATGKKPATVDSEAVLTFVTSATPAPTATATAEESPNPSLAGASPSSAQTPPQTPAPAPPATPTPPASANPAPAGEHPAFTLRDRRIIRNCVSEHEADFPPGTTELSEAPPGTEPQIYRGAKLSPDQQKQVQSLPLACEQQLPGLPGDLERVVYNGRVLLLDSDGRIRDLFNLEDRL